MTPGLKKNSQKIFEKPLQPTLRGAARVPLITTWFFTAQPILAFISANQFVKVRT